MKTLHSIAIGLAAVCVPSAGQAGRHRRARLLHPDHRWRHDRVQFIQAPPPPALPGCNDPLNLPPASVDASVLDSGNWTLRGLPG